jgi:ubiquinone/menaquinone biosynthesis C-methylase UbiE
MSTPHETRDGETSHSHVLHWARLYDACSALCSGLLGGPHRRLLERAAIAPGERVLDVGCGPGRLSQAAAQAAGANGEVLGIDLSSEMIALATQKAARAGSRARFQVASIDALPAADDHFDVVLASLMLHHLSPKLQQSGLAEVRRVLKPQGRLVILEFSATPRHGLAHLLCMLGLRRGSDHGQLLRAAAEAAGFSPVELDLGHRSAFCIIRARKPTGA